MRSVTFLIKPASSLCDLRCRYCFYDDISDLRNVKSMGIMTQATAEMLIQRAVESVMPGGLIHFMFQGGEPTLAGLDFFRRFLKLEEKYVTHGIQVIHAIQTNGMRVDEEWAAFFKKHDFLVGISIDGNKHIHDSLRLDAAGIGTWDRVTAALKILEEVGVETNLLCVVTASVAKNPQKVYGSLKSLGSHPLQFIPCLDPMEAPRGQENYSLTPQKYGKFLCGLFDCWYRDWKQGNYVSIRAFDDYLRILAGMPPSGCANAGTCGSYLVVEGDGSMYPCDFFVLDEWKIGNLSDMTVKEALTSEVSRIFLEESRQRPAACVKCAYRPICRGGCRRDWTRERKNYYCESFRQFFAYALPRLVEMAGALSSR